MNTQNMCHLEGVVQSYGSHGDNWTRYNRHQRGQVRFWLGVPRQLAGEGLDVFLCAIEPHTEEELTHYTTEIRSGRTVQLSAAAKSLQVDIPGESTPGVIFVAESCGFDGREAHSVHQKHGPTGKMAAAADNTLFEQGGGT